MRGYRGGYLPSERRAIEARAAQRERSWASSAPTRSSWASTSGGWTSRCIAGYPGTISGTWQQHRACRSTAGGERGHPGRRCGCPRPLRRDANPDYLFEAMRRGGAARPREHPRAAGAPACGRVRAAVRPGEPFGATHRRTTCWHSWPRRVTCARRTTQRWYWASENFPASEVSLRVAAPENVLIIDTGPDRPRVIGEVDLFSRADAGPRRRHLPPRVAPVPRGPARLGGAQGVRPTGRRRPLHPGRAGRHPQAAGGLRGGAARGRLAPRRQRAHGEVMVSTLATIYKKLKLDTHENLGWGRIHLPETELHSTAWWLSLLDPAATAGWRAGRPRSGARRGRPRAPDRRLPAAHERPA